MGAGVKPGELAPNTVRTMDTAATVLWLLAVDGPTDWAGQPVLGAYTALAAAGAANSGGVPHRQRVKAASDCCAVSSGTSVACSDSTINGDESRKSAVARLHAIGTL